MLRNALLALAVVFTAVAGGPAIGAEADHLRIGLVKFGSGAWEIATIRSHGYDRSAGIAIDSVDLANPAAGEVALQAGGVDAILADWLWVSRQRNAGQHITFIPHTAALGEIMVPSSSPIRALADLEGKRLGVAGGPLDKSWLLLRAYSRRKLGYDLADKVTVVFAAPPLLSRELTAGHIDAALTFWPFAARLSVQGFRDLESMAEIMKELGFTRPVPMLGFALSESWIAAHPGAVDKFLSAVRQADTLLERSDGEWTSLRGLTAAGDDATLIALRNRFRDGIVKRWSAGEQADTNRLFDLMAESGGSDLTGGAQAIATGTFWQGSPP